MVKALDFDGFAALPDVISLLLRDKKPAWMTG
jgi:hypothetical protein